MLSERYLVESLQADCSSPVGAYASQLEDGQIRLTGLVGSETGDKLIRSSAVAKTPREVADGVRRTMLHGFARSSGPLMTERDRGDSEFSARIWLTLTRPSSDGIAARLRKRNFDVLNRPVTRIEELPRPQISSEISLADKNVFLSQHAARIVLSICEEDGIPLTGRFFAIGKATAAIESNNPGLSG